MSESAPISCSRCGLPLAAGTEIHGLCPVCVARGVKTGLGSLLDPMPPEKDAMALEIAGYDIHELIGGGGMGEVYRARDLATGAAVALKVLAGRWTRDPEVAARFAGEAGALARLDHPHIVRVLGTGETGDGRLFLATEYVDGCDLRRLLRAQKLEPERAFTLFDKVCQGVAHAHSRGIVHRDLKPANILTGSDGTVKVADFGIAKDLSDPSGGYGFTRTTDSFGTPYYIAPEVSRGAEKADARADVYALGVLLYEMLAGAVPMGQFTPLSEKTGLDKRLDGLMRQALADDPDKRLASVEELRTGVARIAADHGTRRRMSGRWRALAALAAVLAVGTAAGSWLTLHHERKARQPQVWPHAGSATKERPWENSLGMKFVPVPGTTLLASVWETRRKDYQTYVDAGRASMPDWRASLMQADKRPVIPLVRPDEPDFDSPPPTWDNPGFAQTPDHPVVGISLREARLFCSWLTWTEQGSGHLRPGQRYRLPSDAEWSVLARISNDPGPVRPRDFPLPEWTDRPPLPEGNFAGPEVRRIPGFPEGSKVRPDHTDEWPRTAPVGSWPPNEIGLYDLAGNVAEWTTTRINTNDRTNLPIYAIRGGAWSSGNPRDSLPVVRQGARLRRAQPDYGFRVLLDLESPPEAPQALDPVEPASD